MFLQDMSNREKSLWSKVLLDVIIALYFFPAVFAMEGGMAANVDEIASLIRTVIVLAIVGSLVIYWLLKAGKAEKKDERDYQFEARSYLVGYAVMLTAVSIFIGHIILNELTVRLFDFQYEDLNSLQIVIYLLLSLTLAEFFKDATKLFYYRRGY
ncbi:MAG: hypothetical protein L3J50_07300 [Emcibacter sp.]|nr:hypothetical protein [Emcibacter sp.]